MSDHPLLLTAWGVRAVLAGTKTETRRAIRPQPLEYSGIWPWSWRGGDYTTDVLKDILTLHCPYGQPGDRLWVRETWWEQSGDLYYKADWPNEKPVNMVFDKGRWRPSIFMPREMSRITLPLISVGIEQVQEVTEAGAVAEGCVADEVEVWWQGYKEWDMGDGQKEEMHQQATGEQPPDWMIDPKRMLDIPELRRTARDKFRAEWDALNAKKGYGWDTNPWVFVLRWAPYQELPK